MNKNQTLRKKKGVIKKKRLKCWMLKKVRSFDFQNSCRKKLILTFEEGSLKSIESVFQATYFTGGTAEL